MDRTELERLDRDALIARAEGAGVLRARILTRPELIDELLLRDSTDEPSKRRARGFFGRARDLLSKVIEKGLHLPDAAPRGVLREPPLSIPPGKPLPTVTLAGIYAAQGHREKAVSTLREVLESEPEHDDARSLLSELDRPSYIPPPMPTFPQEETAGIGAGDDSDESPRDPADDPAMDAERDAHATIASSSLGASATTDNEVCAIPLDRTTLFICWNVSEPTLLSLRQHSPQGAVTVRVVTIKPTWDGPLTRTHDLPAGLPTGERLLSELDGADIVRVALGWRDAHTFAVITHSPALELAGLESPASAKPQEGAPARTSKLVRWTPVGFVAVGESDLDGDRIARAAVRARARVLDQASLA